MSIRKWIRAIIGDQRHTLQERLFRLITTIGLIGLLFGLIVGILNGESLVNVIAVLGILLLLALIVSVTLRSGRIETGSIVLSALVLFIVLPFNFITAGGIYGGAPIWFILGFVLALIVVEGRCKYVLLTGQQRYMIFVVVMQTVAANLGSMSTPIGNPQNLYIYSAFHLTAADFFHVVLIYTLLAFPLLLFSVVFCPKGELSVSLPEAEKELSKKHIILYIILFLLCLLSVFHVLHYMILLAVICTALLIADRPLFREIDYSLLLTFVCFFVFAGNIGAIDTIRVFLQNLLHSHPLLTSMLASQIISNVPAAVLLSGFTQDWESLLIGTDIGGLGTPIASLASLISLRLYMRSENAKVGRYLGFFMLANIVGLLLALIFIYFAQL